MDSNRLFIYGVVVLLLGVQLRLVESFELNERATGVVERYFPSAGADSTTSTVSDSGLAADSWQTTPAATSGHTRRIQHARQLAFSLISAGAVMILISPAYRK
jgi:hypothetical protein